MKGMCKQDVKNMMADDMLGTEERFYKPLFDTIEARDELMLAALKAQACLDTKVRLKKRLTPSEAVAKDYLDRAIERAVGGEAKAIP